ncbi:hypothetical protein GIB67_036268, partial [Kingdonia uniflora]
TSQFAPLFDLKKKLENISINQTIWFSSQPTMSRPSWLVDSKRIATKIKSASQACDSQRLKWKSNPSRACPQCNHIIDNTDVNEEWPGLPRGVKFDPSDQEIIWHLLAKIGVKNMKSHPFIDEFIPTVDENDGICYTHPRNLPGVKQDGSVSHFFHRAIKAYSTGTRKRRKIHGEDQGDVRWHKTGRTKPVILDGLQKGCKKIMVLYVSMTKGGKAEKTNWVMHQYHLGMEEDEKDGEFVISKVLYQQSTKPGEKIEQDLPLDVSEPSIPKVDPITPKSVIPEQPRHTERRCSDIELEQKEPAIILNEASDKSLKTINLQETELELLGDFDNHIGEDCVDFMDGHEDHSMNAKNWWDGESQFLLDSQQLVEGLHLCDELLQSQSSSGEADGEEGKAKPCLSDYSRIGVEHLKKDLEECQNLDQLDASNICVGRKLKPGITDYTNIGVENDNQDSEEYKNSDHFDPSSIMLDTPPDFRLSQLEFGSQDSFLAWGGNKITD